MQNRIHILWSVIHVETDIKTYIQPKGIIKFYLPRPPPRISWIVLCLLNNRSEDEPILEDTENRILNPDQISKTPVTGSFDDLLEKRKVAAPLKPYIYNFSPFFFNF